MKQTTREKWRERVRKWKSSGLTAKKFARGRGFSPSSLRNWSSRLRTERGDSKSGSKRTAPPCVEIIGAAGLVGRGSRQEPEQYEVLIERPLRVRVPPAFDQAALLRLIGALEHG